MNTNPSGDEFGALTRLLALKRHEVPPPGYFENFPARVIARLEEEPQGVFSRWWARLGIDFDFKPAAICAFGVVLSSLFVGGLITAQGYGLEAGRLNAGLGGFNRSPFELAAAMNGPVNPADVPASMAPVLPSASPFGGVGLQSQVVKFNVLFTGTR